jgi:hypothetical protein
MQPLRITKDYLEKGSVSKDLEDLSSAENAIKEAFYNKKEASDKSLSWQNFFAWARKEITEPAKKGIKLDERSSAHIAEVFNRVESVISNNITAQIRLIHDNLKINEAAHGRLTDISGRKVYSSVSVLNYVQEVEGLKQPINQALEDLDSEKYSELASKLDRILAEFQEAFKELSFAAAQFRV